MVNNVHFKCNNIGDLGGKAPLAYGGGRIYPHGMRKQDAIKALKAHAEDIRARGVLSLSIFGSTARGEAGPDSDVDILIDIGEDHDLTVTDLIGIGHYLDDILAAPCDVTVRANIKPFLKDNILSEAETVF
ncbi:MAG TPA: hypothetical protein ENI79_04935 [Rhodospirillales bacterium]|nr:hypothetical protein [Rhodospirillales bacterium]